MGRLFQTAASPACLCCCAQHRRQWPGPHSRVSSSIPRRGAFWWKVNIQVQRFIISLSHLEELQSTAKMTLREITYYVNPPQNVPPPPLPPVQPPRGSPPNSTRKELGKKNGSRERLAHASLPTHLQRHVSTNEGPPRPDRTSKHRKLNPAVSALESTTQRMSRGKISFD